MKFLMRVKTFIVIGIISFCIIVFAACPMSKSKDFNLDSLKAKSTSEWSNYSSPPNILIENVTIVDVKDGTLVNDCNILLENAHIKRIIRGKSIMNADDAVRFDGSGKYVMPGLINMHMHILDQPDPSPMLALALANGITGYRQMSGSSELLKLRKNGLSLLPQQPDALVMPGSVLTPINTHNVQQAIVNVRQQKLDGADFIKIGLLPPNTFFATLAEARRQKMPALGHVPGDISTVIASDSGMHSIEHLGLNYAGLTACSKDEFLVRESAPKTPSLLSHLPNFTEKLFMSLIENRIINPARSTSKEEYRRLKRVIETFDEVKARRVSKIYLANQTWQCPTLSKLKSYQLAFLPEVKNDFGAMPKSLADRYKKVTEQYEKELTPEIRRELLKAYQLELKLVKIYDEEGLKILAGTDNSGGYTLWQEFNELAKAGLTPLHILQSGTINCAEFLRLNNIGQIKQGYKANLLILDGNPLMDINNVKCISAVIHSGYLFKENDLINLKTKAIAELNNE